MSTEICVSHIGSGNERHANPKWLAERKKGVTATDAAKLMSGASWMNLWAHKTNRMEKENLDDNERVQWGNLMEPVILQAYSSERYAGREVYPSGCLVRSNDYPWLLATLDARTTHPEFGLIPLDAKNADKFMEERWAEGPPEQYAWQIRTQAVIEDTVASSIACALGGNRLLWADDVQTAANVEHILAVTEKFWWHVANDVPPDAFDGSPETKKALDATFTRVSDGEIELGRTFTELDMEYGELKDRISWRATVDKTLNVRCKEIEAMFRRVMEDHSAALLDNGVRWTLKRITREPYKVEPKPYNKLTRKVPK